MAKGKSNVIVDIDRLVTKLSEAMNKLLLKQEVRTYAQMSKLEERFEKHTTKLKSDFLEKIDPILKEVKTAREERTLIESRLEALENIHRKGKHSLPSTI